MPILVRLAQKLLVDDDVGASLQVVLVDLADDVGASPSALADHELMSPAVSQPRVMYIPRRWISDPVPPSINSRSPLRSRTAMSSLCMTFLAASACAVARDARIPRRASAACYPVRSGARRPNGTGSYEASSATTRAGVPPWSNRCWAYEPRAELIPNE